MATPDEPIPSAASYHVTSFDSSDAPYMLISVRSGNRSRNRRAVEVFCTTE